MKLAIVFALTFMLGFNSAVGSNDTLQQLKELKTLKSEQVDMIYPLFSQVAKQLKKKWNEPLAEEFARVLNITMGVQPNYFVLDSFYDLLKDQSQKNKLDTVLKKHLTAEHYSLYEENVLLLIREVEQGN
jgi:hypothetical protein